MKQTHTRDTEKTDEHETVKPEVHAVAPDPRATADADGFTVLDTDHLLGPVGFRDRVVRSNYEHVSEASDGAWIYRRM